MGWGRPATAPNQEPGTLSERSNRKRPSTSSLRTRWPAIRPCDPSKSAPRTWAPPSALATVSPAVLQYARLARRCEPAAGRNQSARYLRADVRGNGFEGAALCPPQGKGEPARLGERGNCQTEALAG